MDPRSSLDALTIASPCQADWSSMTGDERVRFCAVCRKNVYNLSAMSAAGAEALVRQAEDRICVQFYRRPDGTVLTADCPVGALRRRLRRLARLAAVVTGIWTIHSYFQLTERWVLSAPSLPAERLGGLGQRLRSALRLSTEADPGPGRILRGEMSAMPGPAELGGIRPGLVVGKPAPMSTGATPASPPISASGPVAGP